MKIPQLLTRKKKLRASTARRSLAAADEMDYEEMSEPNMKLSRALLIVLVLHVVAVAGIIAFNTIKSRQGAFPSQPALASLAPAEAPAPLPAVADTGTDRTVAKREETKAALPLTKAERETDSGKAAAPVSAATEKGKTYVVVKGDNPVSIARRLKVSESELLSVNHIDDPRKLQIGQKLIVPATKKAKKN